MSSEAKEAKKIIRILERNGWMIDYKRKHPYAIAPGGTTGVPISLSPSCHRWKKNLLNQIKKQYGPVPGLH